MGVLARSGESEWLRVLGAEVRLCPTAAGRFSYIDAFAGWTLRRVFSSETGYTGICVHERV